MARHLRAVAVIVCLLCAALLHPPRVRAQDTDRIYFPAVESALAPLLAHISAETTRLDIGVWYLSEHAVSLAIAERFHAGVPVRLLTDHMSVFVLDPNTRREIEWLAGQGVPIRLRNHPLDNPEADILHWKAAIFAGQNLVEFGSANYTPLELAPESPSNYKDETAQFSSDPAIVAAFKSRFDQMWVDEESFADWPAAYAFATGVAWSGPPMAISRLRLEPDAPDVPEFEWAQGGEFARALYDAIAPETARIDVVAYRLTIDAIADTLLWKYMNGAPVRLIIEPDEYRNTRSQEFPRTAANLDRLWAAGLPIRQRVHGGLTHMKTLVTSSIALNGSSNITELWQRDHNDFIPAATRPALYAALRDRFEAMWTDGAAFGPFVPLAPDAPQRLTPENAASNQPAQPVLAWTAAVWATAYDVYLGSSPGTLALAGATAQTSWSPPNALAPGGTYYWKVVSRTNATVRDASLVAPSSIQTFQVAASTDGIFPDPEDGATGVSTSATLRWRSASSQFDVYLGTTNPPPLAADGVAGLTLTPAALAPGTTYFWRVVAHGSSVPGSAWQFTTEPVRQTSAEIVIHAAAIDDASLHGAWTRTPDPSAADGVSLSTADRGWSATAAPLAAPADYVDVDFAAPAGVAYHMWIRLRAASDVKSNDSVWIQFSDAVAGGAATYRVGTTSGLLVNLEPCSNCGMSGWGWQDGAWWMAQHPVVEFANGGTHTIRVQVREDGVAFDQIVLSPSAFLDAAPGPAQRDGTIVPIVGSDWTLASAASLDAHALAGIDIGSASVVWAGGPAGLSVHSSTFTSSGDSSWFAERTDSVTDLTALTSEPGALIASIGVGGVVSSADWGQTWQPANAGLLPRHTWQLAVTSAGTVSAATSSGVMTHVAPNGWRAAAPAAGAAVAIAADSGGSNTMFAAFADGRLLRTSDNWATVTPAAGLPSVASALAVRNDRVAAALAGGQIYLSTDDGATFAPIETGGSAGANRVAFDPVNADVLWAGTLGGGLIRCTVAGCAREDAGWLAYVTSMAFDASSDWYAAGSGVLRSDDAGATWSPVTSPVDVVLALAVDAGVVYAATGSGIFRSTDRGSTWVNVSPRAAIALGAAADGIYAAVDAGGVVTTRDHGDTWNTDPGFAPLVGKLASDPADGRTFYAATPDGVFVSTDTGQHWTTTSLADPVDVLASSANASTLIALSAGRVVYSSDRGATWRVSASFATTGAYALSVAIADDGVRAYIGTYRDGVWTSADGGATWSAAAVSTTSPVLAVYADRSAAETIYAGTAGDGVWVSRDGGASWARLGNALRSAIVWTMMADPADARALYAGTAAGIFRIAYGSATE